MNATTEQFQAFPEKSLAVEDPGFAVDRAASELPSESKDEKSAVEKDREAFRKAVVSTLDQRLFFNPSFGIYRDRGSGVAGLYDYGPRGRAVELNVLSLWRKVLIRSFTCTIRCFLFTFT